MNENMRKGTASPLILTDNRAEKAALESGTQLPLNRRQSGCHESLALTLKLATGKHNGHVCTFYYLVKYL